MKQAGSFFLLTPQAGFLLRHGLTMNKIGEKSVERIASLSKKPSCTLLLRELYPASYVKLLDMVKGRPAGCWSRENPSHGRCGRRLASAFAVQLGVQTLERNTAIRLSREVKDWLGGIIQEYPHPFRRF